MSSIRYFLQDPPLGFLIRSRLERWSVVTATRRRRRSREADCYLLSYPKTGRTWVRVMMGQLLARHCGHAELAQVELGARMPRFAGVPHVAAKHDGTPQKKTAAEINPDRSEFAGCRVILLVRDLRDTVVSNYFQVTRRQIRYAGDMASYVRWPRGSFDGMLRYYNVWAQQRRVPQAFLLVRYEDLHTDTPRELRRIADFLQLRDVRDASIAGAVDYASFGAMKNREASRPADASVLAPGRAG
ncbi:MAG TPA: sulfotransferase domain-containing protein, partial [Steroidobacteraceae bacterium]